MAWVRLREGSERFEMVPYQEAPSPPMTPELAEACERAFHVITADGRMMRAGRASLFVLAQLGFPRIARVLGWPPFIWFIELGYYLVARNRKLFGRFMFTRERPGEDRD